MSHDEPITIRVTRRVWNGMYGEVDNAIDLAIGDNTEDGEDDETVIDIGSQILERSSRQCQQTGVNESTPWDQMIAITLTREQWLFILDQGKRSTPIYEQLGDDQSLALIRDARAVITVQLDIT